VPGGQLLAKLAELAVLSGLAVPEETPKPLRAGSLPAAPKRGADPCDISADLRKRLPGGAGLDSGAEWVRASSSPDAGGLPPVLRRRPCSLVSVIALPVLVILLIRLVGSAKSVSTAAQRTSDVGVTQQGHYLCLQGNHGKSGWAKQRQPSRSW